jgi:hypothetical protein
VGKLINPPQLYSLSSYKADSRIVLFIQRSQIMQYNVEIMGQIPSCEIKLILKSHRIPAKTYPILYAFLHKAHQIFAHGYNKVKRNP